MACPEARLKGFIELMVGHVLPELGGNCSFQDIAQERKVGDWSMVMQVVWVQTWLLEDGGDRSCFEDGQNLSDSRDELIMSTIRGHRASREDFTRVVGVGSKEQVEAFALETNLATEIEKEEGEH